MKLALIVFAVILYVISLAMFLTHVDMPQRLVVSCGTLHGMGLITVFQSGEEQAAPIVCP